MVGAKSILKPLIPEDFHPLLNCVSANAFKVVDWKAILKDIPTLTKRVTTHSGVEALIEAQMRVLPLNEITVTLPPRKSEQPIEDPDFGQTLLKIYFSQLESSAGVFLDLRQNQFGLNKNGNRVWCPNGLWVQFSNPFRGALSQVYEGYYNELPTSLNKGLMRLGLIREDFTKEQSQEVIEKVLFHIGGNTQSQEFQVRKFTESFEALFELLLKNKVRLQSDFFYFGIYLASLYTHLEHLKGTYNVQAAYQNTKDQIRGKKSDTPFESF